MRADHAVPPAELGVVQRGIRSGENLIQAVARPPFADAHAPGERDAILAGVERLRREPAAQILRNLDRLRQGAILQEQRKLVAAEPADHGLGQERGSRTAADRLVADFMPIGVVDVFEIVDIENDRRQASIGGATRAQASVARSKKPRLLLKPVRGSMVASRIKSRCIARIRSAARNRA